MKSANNNNNSDSDNQRTRPDRTNRNNRTSRTRRRYPVEGVCTGDNVRLRSRPGTESRVLGRADMDDVLTVVGEETYDGETWYRIENPSGRGKLWIHGDYVEITD